MECSTLAMHVHARNLYFVYYINPAIFLKDATNILRGTLLKQRIISTTLPLMNTLCNSPVYFDQIKPKPSAGSALELLL